LPHEPLPCKAGRTTGCNYFAPHCVRTIPRFGKNLLCPCSRTAHNCSAHFRPKLFC
jgi:hypothetical protein